MEMERRPEPQRGEPVEFNGEIWYVEGPTEYWPHGFDEPSETWFILSQPGKPGFATANPNKFTREATQVTI